jgi:hypothetical protein
VGERRKERRTEREKDKKNGGVDLNAFGRSFEIGFVACDRTEVIAENRLGADE